MIQSIRFSNTLSVEKNIISRYDLQNHVSKVIFHNNDESFEIKTIIQLPINNHFIINSTTKNGLSLVVEQPDL